MHIKSAAIAVALILATGGYSAFAQSGSAVEAAALDAVTVTLAEAVSAVEAKNTGKVVEAALVTEGTTSVYQITTMQTGGTETNYAVDASSGAVVVTVDMEDGHGKQGDEGPDGKNDGPNGDGDGETQDDTAN